LFCVDPLCFWYDLDPLAFGLDRVGDRRFDIGITAAPRFRKAQACLSQ
jgi:hypothetical protein